MQACSVKHAKIISSERKPQRQAVGRGEAGSDAIIKNNLTYLQSPQFIKQFQSNLVTWQYQSVVMFWWHIRIFHLLWLHHKKRRYTSFCRVSIEMLCNYREWKHACGNGNPIMSAGFSSPSKIVKFMLLRPWEARGERQPLAASKTAIIKFHAHAKSILRSIYERERKGSWFLIAKQQQRQ